MSEWDTLEQPTLKDILDGLNKIDRRLDGFEKRLDGFENRLDRFEKRLDAHDQQFEAIRQGIVDNSVRFDRTEAALFSIRSDVSNLKADIKELTEEVRQNQKTLALK